MTSNKLEQKADSILAKIVKLIPPADRAQGLEIANKIKALRSL